MKINKGIYLLFENISGHRQLWIEEILRSEKFQTPNLYLVVICNKSSFATTFKLRQSHEKLLVFNSMRTWKKVMRKNRCSSKDISIIYMDGDKKIFWNFLRSKNYFLIMRPFNHNFSPFSLVRFTLKKFFIVAALMRNSNSVRQLSLPNYLGGILKKSFIQDDLTENRLDKYLLKTPKYFCPENDEPYFLITGFLSPRKGINQAIDFVEAYNTRYEGVNHHLRIRGTNMNVKICNHRAIKIDFIEGFMIEDEYYKNIMCAKFVLIYYRNIGASGLLLESMKLGVPVITNNRRLYKKMRNSGVNSIYYADEILKRQGTLIPEKLNAMGDIRFQNNGILDWILDISKAEVN